MTEDQIRKEMHSNGAWLMAGIIVVILSAGWLFGQTGVFGVLLIIGVLLVFGAATHAVQLQKKLDRLDDERRRLSQVKPQPAPPTPKPDLRTYKDVKDVKMH